MANSYLDRVGNKALGEMLVEKGALSEEQVTEALEQARQQGVRLGEALVGMGYIGTDALSYTIAEQYGQRPMELHPSMVDGQLLGHFDADLLSRHEMLPLIELEDELVVVVADPQDSAGLDALAGARPGKKITPQLGDAGQIRRCLDSYLSERAVNAGGGALCGGEAAGDQWDLRASDSFGGVPAAASPDLQAWLFALAAEHSHGDLRLRAEAAGLEIFVPADASGVRPILLEQARLSEILPSVLQDCVAVAWTDHQVWRKPGVGRLGGKTFEFAVITPRTEGAPEMRIRAKSADPIAEAPAGELQIDFAERGTVTLVDAGAADPAEAAKKVAILVHSLAARREPVVVVSPTWPWPRDCAAAVYPAPFADAVAAVQAHAAHYLVYDYVPTEKELARGLLAGGVPPAVVVVANGPPGAGPMAGWIDWPELQQVAWNDLFEKGAY